MVLRSLYKRFTETIIKSKGGKMIALIILVYAICFWTFADIATGNANIREIEKYEKDLSNKNSKNKDHIL